MRRKPVNILERTRLNESQIRPRSHMIKADETHIFIGPRLERGRHRNMKYARGRFKIRENTFNIKKIAQEQKSAEFEMPESLLHYGV